jgi:hypothetical protein
VLLPLLLLLLQLLMIIYEICKMDMWKRSAYAVIFNDI